MATTNNNSIAEDYLTKADNAISSMTGAAQGATSGARAAVGSAASARASAESTATKIGETASTMQGIAGGLLPIADRVEGDAAAVRGIAGQNLDMSKPWFQQSEGLLNMDEKAGGISGEFASLYKQLDPELQMALAASDARKEAQSQTNSAVRSLQRAGVSPTASALASIREKAANQTAALVASVKTKARQSGVTMQMDALGRGISMAIAQSGVGQKFTEDATSAYASASQMENISGSLKSGAASIYGSSANLLSNAQGMIQAAANGEISANSTQISAAQAVVGAFATAAEYYSIQASSFRGLAESGDGESGDRESGNNNSGGSDGWYNPNNMVLL